MILKVKNLIASLVVLFSFALPVAMPSSVMAAATPTPQNSLCGGAVDLKLDPASQCGATAGTEDTINDKIAKIINILSIIVGIVAVIMIIWGGFRYITSGGSSDKVTSAKNTLLYAIIGLVIVALAQIIVRFVLNKTTQA
jgi:hypothetical protein